MLRCDAVTTEVSAIPQGLWSWGGSLEMTRAEARGPVGPMLTVGWVWATPRREAKLGRRNSWGDPQQGGSPAPAARGLRASLLKEVRVAYCGIHSSPPCKPPGPTVQFLQELN